MKKTKLTVALLSATLAVSVIPSVVSAADENIAIDTTNFEDPNFVTYLKKIEKNTDNGYDADGAFSEDELLKLTSIKPGANVTSLKGIEKLTHVTSVNINGNQNITSLDLSSNAEMKNVHATNCALEELNVTGCKKITKMDLTGSKINSLDISDCTNLNYLDVSNTGNAIKGINISNQKKFVETIYKGEYSLNAIEGESYNCKKYTMQVNNTTRTLVFDENTDLYLAEINETNFPDSSICYMVNRWMNHNHDQYLSLSEKEEVTDIRLNYGTITSLKGLEYFDKVISLYWNECRLEEANLDCFPELETLEIYSNYLTSLDLSANTKLKKLRCENNRFTSLDISNNSELEELYCQNNKLTSLVVSNNPELKILNCSSNNISTIDISNNLSSLDISKNVNIQKLYFAENSISDFDVSHMLSLKELDCANNGISKVDVSNNRYLEILNCSGNDLSNVDVSKNLNLLSLKCANTNISELDISKNLLLEELDCSENKLTEVNILKLDNIRSLDCSCNEISSLEFSPNATKLKSLRCRDNKFTSLDISRFTELTRLSCYKNKIAEIDVSNTSLTTLSHYQPCLDARLNYCFDSYYSGGNAGIDSYLDVDEDTNIVGLIKFPHDSIITPTPTPADEPNPTAAPDKPTPVPGTTTAPIATPTKVPTVVPTANPTVVPTVTPSSTPTVNPTGTPTTVPGGKPTAAPAKPVATATPSVTTSPNTTAAPGATTVPNPTVAPEVEPTKAPSVEDFAERLYTTCLGREAEKEGKDYWVGELKAGKPGSEVAQGFFFSPEFVGFNLDNEEYITRLYRTFMGREPEKDGMNYWLGEMANGQGRVFVFDGFVNSPEWADICLTYGIRSGGLAKPTFEKQATPEIMAFAERLYTTCLGRDAEPEGLKYWSQELANLRQTGTVVAAGFFNSPEFIGLNTSNDEYVTRLYKTFMGRDPEEAGFEFWTSELKAGKDRQYVFDGFSVAPEFANLCADAGIMR